MTKLHFSNIVQAYGKGIAVLESAIPFLYTEQFTDGWTCGWKLFLVQAYGKGIAVLE